ncbi:MAG: hypothetical protein ACRCU3_09335 [Eubacteriaceae bacterium]
MIKKCFKSGFLLAMLGMLFSGGSTVFAGTEGPDADVYMTVIKSDPQTKLSATVPTTYAFVVNGTANTSNVTPISVSDGTLLLPNVTVEVLDNSSSNSEYTINVSGSGALQFKNYSTTMAEVDDSGNPNIDPSLRKGLEIKLDAYIANTGAAPINRNYWEAVAEDGEVTSNGNNFKNYRLSLGEAPNRHVFKNKDLVDNNKIWLDNKIVLEKPIEGEGFNSQGLANVPSVVNLPSDLEVGGYRGQYKQVEQSAKVSNIIWTIEFD